MGKSAKQSKERVDPWAEFSTTVVDYLKIGEAAASEVITLIGLCIFSAYSSHPITRRSETNLHA